MELLVVALLSVGWLSVAVVVVLLRLLVVVLVRRPLSVWGGACVECRSCVVVVECRVPWRGLRLSCL
eukprot:12249323-Prorocentrum_lima.AAC.1